MLYDCNAEFLDNSRHPSVSKDNVFVPLVLLFSLCLLADVGVAVLYMLDVQVKAEAFYCAPLGEVLKYIK